MSSVSYASPVGYMQLFIELDQIVAFQWAKVKTIKVLESAINLSSEMIIPILKSSREDL